MKLVIFDGDDTLWYGLEGANISDNGAGDYSGSNDYTYDCPPASNPDVICRNDDKHLQLFPETRAVLRELKRRDILIALATYNHPDPTYRALDSWSIAEYFDHVEAAWTPDKEQMLRNILNVTGVLPSDAVFIDDDPSRGHRQQAERVGIRFLKRGSDITDLNQVLELLGDDALYDPRTAMLERDDET